MNRAVWRHGERKIIKARVWNPRADRFLTPIQRYEYNLRRYLRLLKAFGL